MKDGKDRIPDVDKAVAYWMESSERDYRTMQNLLRSKDRQWALFMGHLVLEKLLKAHFVRNSGAHALFTHDLLRLATKAGLKPSEEQAEWLDTISTFNINARYDSYKQDFHRICNADFTELWAGRINTLRQWMKEIS